MAPSDAPTDSSTLVYIKVADTFFAIPETYILHPHYRIPGEAEKIEFGFYMPGLRPIGEVRKSHQKYFEESREGRQLNQFVSVTILKDTPENLERTRTTLYPLTPTVHYTFRADESHLGSSKIKEVIDSFIVSNPPEKWDETLELVEALRMNAHRLGPRSTHRHLDSNFLKKSQQKPINPTPVELNVLKKGLKHSSQEIRKASVRWLYEYRDNINEILPIIENVIKNDPIDHVRAEAISALGRVGNDANPLLQTLLETLRDDPSELVAHAVGDHLYKLGRPPVDFLEKHIESSEGRHQHSIVRILSWMVTHDIRKNKLESFNDLAPDSKEALAVLSKNLGGLESRHQVDALNIVAHEASASPAFISATIEALKNGPDYGVKLQAINAIGRMAPHSKEAMPLLFSIINSDELGLYQAAIESLGKFGETAYEAVPRLLELAEFDCDGVTYGTDGILAPPPISEEANRYNNFNVCNTNTIKWIRSRAILALSQIGITSPEIIAVILRAQEDSQPQVRHDAINAYKELEEDRDKLINKLISIANNKVGAAPDFNYALHALASLGEEAKPAIKHLEKFLSSDNEYVRRETEKTISRINGKEQQPKQIPKI